MGYTKQNGEWADTDEIIVCPSTVFAADANGPAIEVGDRSCAVLELDVTAITGGADSAAVKLQTSKDGTGSGLGAWRDVASFATLAAVGSERKSFPGLDRFIRYVVDVTDTGGGGVSATLSIKGELKG